jgi:hypothetical protein
MAIAKKKPVVRKTLKESSKKNIQKPSTNKNESDEVAGFMEELEHPFKSEIEEVRSVIKKSSNKISERIKWKAPSYYYKEDLVTFNLWEQGKIHLVFHNQAIVKIKSDLLQGDYPTRRMTYFMNMKEIKANKKELQRIITELVNYMDH